MKGIMKSGKLDIIMGVVGVIFRVAVLVFSVYAIYQGALRCYDYGYRIFTEPAISSETGQTISVAITENMSASDMGILLKNKGLIRDARLFVLQYYLSEYRKDVKPGIFELSTAMTVEEMMAAMTIVPEEDTSE